MFQIYDCNDRPVGRPEGYKKHSTAQRLAERKGRIKTAIWSAFHASPLPEPPQTTRMVYRIEWQEPIDSPILFSERVITKLAPIREQINAIAEGSTC
jgi:hypothetical protein